jgi:amino acid transporter
VETYILVGWPTFLDNEGENFYHNIRIIGIILWAILITVNLFGIKYVSQAGIIFLFLVMIGILMAFVGIGVAKYDPKLQTETEVGFNGLSAEHCRDNWDS